ncbi:MAG TPA: hypothetical protein VGY58_12110 [Gemmataceae bacterium]|nr:hypothetical protein [Gemmataceae bacterium]
MADLARTILQAALATRTAKIKDFFRLGRATAPEEKNGDGNRDRDANYENPRRCAVAHCAKVTIDAIWNQESAA